MSNSFARSQRGVHSISVKYVTGPMLERANNYRGGYGTYMGGMHAWGAYMGTSILARRDSFLSFRFQHRDTPKQAWATAPLRAGTHAAEGMDAAGCSAAEPSPWRIPRHGGARRRSTFVRPVLERLANAMRQ